MQARWECQSVAVAQLGSGGWQQEEGGCLTCFSALSQLAEPQPAQVQLQQAHV